MIAAAQSNGNIDIIPTDLPGSDVTPTPSSITILVGHDKTVDVLDFSSNSRILLQRVCWRSRPVEPDGTSRPPFGAPW